MAKKKSARTSTTNSKLFDPDSPIHTLASKFQDAMYLPNPDALYAVMGAVAGNMLTGDPVWMMVVGSSGSGKTQLLKSLGKIKRIETVSSIKGEAGLLSAVKEKDRA